MRNNHRTERMHSLPAYYHRQLPVFARSCGFAIWQGDMRIDRECSELCGIEQVISGTAHFTQGGREYALAAGEVYLLQPAATHRYSAGDSGLLVKRHVGVAGDSLARIWRTLGLSGCDVICPQEPRVITRHLLRLAHLLRRKPAGYVRASSREVYALLLALGQDAASPMPGVVQNAVDFINRNLGDEELNGVMLAARAVISLPHFNRVFRTHIHLSPGQYIQAQRIESAKLLLSDTRLTVAAVARACGYVDPLYFSTRFRRLVGSSPRGWRQQHHDGSAYKFP